MPTSTDRAIAGAAASAGTPPWRIDEINALAGDEFTARLGFLFEGSPWIAAGAWPARPWRDRESLHAALLGVVANASKAHQLELIRAHPDLAGRAALDGRLGQESTAEQRAAGLDPGALTAADIDAFRAGNAAYQERFGFPFVVCAREHQKEQILARLADRLKHEPDEEIAIALAEVGKIAWYRLADVVTTDESTSGGDRMALDYTYEVTYGKQGVPVYRVFATPLGGVRPIPESSFIGRENNLLACEISVEVFGDEFLPAYTEGDNAMVVATDSMKNFIIRESLAYPGSTMEGLLYFLGDGFGQGYAQMHTLRLTGAEIPFSPVVVPVGDGRFEPGGNVFSRNDGERAVASVSVARRGDHTEVTGHDCGIVGIKLMKLTGSAFTSFVRDDYTTLPERGDRPLYIALDARWRYTDAQDLLDVRRGNYVPREQMNDLLAATFDDFISESIQHLLHEMGDRALRRFPQLSEIRFSALNLTRDPYRAREDDPRVKVYSDPFPAYGRLTLAMRRKA